MRSLLIALACIVAINVFILPEMEWLNDWSTSPKKKEQIPDPEHLERPVARASELPKSLASEQMVKINLMEEPPTLDPAQGADDLSANVMKALFDGLTRLNLAGKPEPSVAESIDISPDHRTYIFHLRETYWSNGDPVTAQDFEYAWKRVLDPQFDSLRPDTLYVIKNAQAVKRGDLSADELGIYVPDERTLVVALEHPYPAFLSLLANPECMPVPMAVDQLDPQWMGEAATYVCNGPFRMKSWRHNYEIVLERNPNYWDVADVKLQSITYMMMSDVQTELNMFEAGDLHWAGRPFSDLPPEALPALRKGGELQLHPQTATYLFLLNTDEAPFNNKKFRLALSYGINRQALVEHVSQGGQIPALRLIPPVIGMQDRVYFRDDDIERAQDYLKQALLEMGMSKEELPALTLSYNTLEVNKQVALMLQQEWKRNLGITVKLENADWKVHLSRIYKRQYQISRYGAGATVDDALDLMQNFSRAMADGGNVSPWQHFHYSQLLDQARNAELVSQREEFLLEAERVFMEEMPAIPIYHYTISYVKSPKLRDVLVSSQGIADLKWAWLSQ